jgi:hypothetical protein
VLPILAAALKGFKFWKRTSKTLSKILDGDLLFFRSLRPHLWYHTYKKEDNITNCIKYQQVNINVLTLLFCALQRQKQK